MKHILSNKDFGTSIVTLIVSIGLYLSSSSLPIASRRYPQGLLIIFMVLASLMLATTILKGVKQDVEAEGSKSDPEKSKRLVRSIVTTVMCILYIYLISFLGYFTATLIFLSALMIYLGVKNFKTILPVAIGICLFIYLLFSTLLSVPIPRGLLF